MTETYYIAKKNNLKNELELKLICKTFYEFRPLLFGNDFCNNSVEIMELALKSGDKFVILNEKNTEYSLFEFLGIISYEKRTKTTELTISGLSHDSEGFCWINKF